MLIGYVSGNKKYLIWNILGNGDFGYIIILNILVKVCIYWVLEMIFI